MSTLLLLPVGSCDPMIAGSLDWADLDLHDDDYAGFVQGT